MEQYIFKGPVQQNGGPARVELQEIPQVSPVQLNDGGEPQPRAITSWLQPSKPSQSASAPSIPQPYRKYGQGTDPMELQRMLPEFPDSSHAQLRHQRLRAARSSIAWLGCLLSPQWHLKKVWEKGGVEK